MNRGDRKGMGQSGMFTHGISQVMSLLMTARSKETIIRHSQVLEFTVCWEQSHSVTTRPLLMTLAF